MYRYFYISDQLQDIQLVQEQLVAKGFRKDQFHVLSGEDAELDRRSLNPVPELEKKNLMSFGLKGFAVGLLCAGILLALVHSFELANNELDWFLFSFLSLAILGFCTWEGGLIGIQLPNSKLKRFQQMLSQGKHILLLDIDPDQKPEMFNVTNRTKSLRFAGSQRLTVERIFSH